MQQSLCHLSLLLMLKMGIVARDSQAGMSNLIFHEIAGHRVCLHMADSAVSESVHPTGNDTKRFAERRQDASANIAIFQRGAKPRLKESAALTASKEVPKQIYGHGIQKHIPLPGFCLRLAFHAIPYSTANFNDAMLQLQVFNPQADKFPGARLSSHLTTANGSLSLIKRSILAFSSSRSSVSTIVFAPY